MPQALKLGKFDYRDRWNCCTPNPSNSPRLVGGDYVNKAIEESRRAGTIDLITDPEKFTSPARAIDPFCMLI
ncbi:MAG: hypothetical protein WKF75_13330 [Singulisphaera sp.]